VNSRYTIVLAVIGFSTPFWYQQAPYNMNDATGTALGQSGPEVGSDGVKSALLSQFQEFETLLREEIEKASILAASEENIQRLLSRLAGNEKSIADLDKKFKNLSAARDADERPCVPDNVNSLQCLSPSMTNALTSFTLVSQLQIALRENRNLQRENRDLLTEKRMLDACNARLRASEADLAKRHKDFFVIVDRVIRALEGDIVLKDETIRDLRSSIHHFYQGACRKLNLTEEARDQAMRERDFYHEEMHRAQRQLEELQRQSSQEAVPAVESAMQTHALFRFTETGNDSASSVSSATSNETLVEAESEGSDYLGQSDDHTGTETNANSEARNAGEVFIERMERLAEIRARLRGGPTSH
jgi:hypothetical protein